MLPPLTELSHRHEVRASSKTVARRLRVRWCELKLVTVRWSRPTFYGERRISVQQPSATADDPLPDLVRALRNASAAIRFRAAKDLGRLGWLAREAMPALVHALDDEDAKVRETAAHAIGGMGPEALIVLVRMLEHHDKYVRRHAVWALGKLGPLARAALPDLCRSLKDPDPRAASGAAQALGNLGADGADGVLALAEAMRGTNIVLCRLASKALSQIGPPALATLIAHLQHADPFVRGESALALGWMGTPARSAVPFLARVLRGSDVALSHTPAPTVTPTAIPVPNDSAALTPPQLNGPDGTSAEMTCRVYAAQALGRIGSAAAAALPDLRDAARHAPEPLCAAAQQAVRQIQGT
ncbi:HEAT repeat protein [Gemmata obscuriglobus]|nr:HEAT repeat protein [Gemmata obscuriglobus]VTS04352.1 heat repeat-containing protein : HEAT repeat-containing protein OS=Leptolyngbya sp. PCC 7375 GN=Lepto7375DRAFT_2567 PE=4 SV=1: HEAT_PBS: HEAT_2: HEAT_2 [Gemmata obscuriglobus UQM 2246]